MGKFDEQRYRYVDKDGNRKYVDKLPRERLTPKDLEDLGVI